MLADIDEVVIAGPRLERGEFTAAPVRVEPRAISAEASVEAAVSAEASTEVETVAARNNARYRHILPAVDLLAGVAAMLAARGIEGVPVLHWDLLAACLLPLLAKFVELYDTNRVTIRRSTLDEAPRLVMVAALWAVLWSLITAVFGVHLVWRGSGGVGIMWASLCATLVFGRSCVRSQAKRLTGPERVLIVGGAYARQSLAHSLSTDPSAHLEVVGYLPLEDERREQKPLPAGIAQDRRSRRQGLDDLPGMAKRLRIDRVLLVAGANDSERMVEALHRVNELGLRVSLLPQLFEVVGSAVEFDNVGGVTVLGLRRPGLSRSSLMLKRLTDILGAGVAVALASPILLATALAIKLDTPGPVFFRQKRVGRDGQEFDILKFRSMVNGAEAQREMLAHRNETQGLFKMADDPRITRVGRLLRKTSLDELPQILNVLRGDMSLVGPRPLVPSEDVLVEGRHRDRLTLAPGMTGPWQILGPNRPPLAEMVKTDYLYAVTWSLWLDIKLMLRTVAHVKAARGQ